MNIEINDVKINTDNVTHIKKWVDDEAHEDNPNPTNKAGLTFYFVSGEKYSVSFDTVEQRDFYWKFID